MIVHSSRFPLDELRLHIKKIPVDNVEAFLHGLFAAYDQTAIKTYELSNFELTYSDSDVKLLQISLQILNSLFLGRSSMTLEKRSEIISRTIKDCRSLTMITFLVRQEYLNHHPEEQGKPPKNQGLWLMTESDMEDLRQTVLEKIENAAKDDSLLSIRRLRDILLTWTLLASSQECEKARAWCMEKLHDDFAVEKFAEVFILKDLTSRAGNPITIYSIPMETLKKFLEPEKLKQRVEEVLEKTNPQSKRSKVLKRFLNAYENNQIDL